jgi:DNA end-binding protein Ku
MARPTWRGSISFGLVSVPVQLFTAVRPKTIRFKQLHAATKAPVRQKRVDEETGDEVAYRDIVKGYEVGEDRYVVVDPEELTALDPEASRLIDILDYVEAADIDPIYYDRAYYLTPDGEIATKPYRLLLEAMERAQKVAIASLVMRNRAYLAAIRAQDGLLLLSTMHYHDEVADPAELDADLGDDVAIADREVAMAEQLIESLTTEFDPAAYRDEHRERVLEFLEARAEGEQIDLAPERREAGNVVDLVAALEQSLARARGDQSDEDSTAPQPREDRGGGREDRGGGREDRGRTPDYEAMTRDELYALAKERDVPGRSSLSKPELVAALAAGDRESGAA